MADKICSICTGEYDLSIHRPKSIICGHIFCSSCIQKFIEDTGNVSCPNGDSVDIRNFIEFSEPANLIDYLEKIQLKCLVHDIDAVGFNTQSFQAVCSLCEMSYISLSQALVIISRKLSIELNRVKKSLSKEFREIIKFSINSNLKTILTLFYAMKLYLTTSTKCSIHGDTNAVSISPTKLTLCCERCGDDNKLDISLNAPIDIVRFFMGHGFAGDEKNLIFSAIPRYIAENGEFSPKPFIELLLIKNFVTNNLERYGCQKCGKLFHLGPRMPMKLGCSHFICFTCSRIVSKCIICSQNIQSMKPFPIEALYKPMKCMFCIEANPINFENLPFHWMCNCIICSSCSKLLKYCRDCNENSVCINDFFPKLHKRSVRIINYLDTKIKCYKCFKAPAELFTTESPYIAVCSNCNNQNQNSISLKDIFYLENYLLRFVEYLGINESSTLSLQNFESLTLKHKMKILSELYTGIPKDSVKYQDIREIRRFKILYPIAEIDKKCFKVDSNEICLLVNSSIPVKLCGIILAGSINLDEINVGVYVMNQKRNEYLRIKNAKFKGKEGFVMFPELNAMSEFSIYVQYADLNRQLFTGKFSELNYAHNGEVTFIFKDPNKRQMEYYGPILGFLYSLY